MTVVASPNQRFLELAAELDRMPTTPCPGLRFIWDDAAPRVSVADDDRPLAELVLHATGEPSELDIFAHSLQSRRDGAWLSRVRWRGRGSLMPMPDCAVQVHPHRFWGDLPLAQLGLAPMMALVAGPDELRFTFAPPRPWQPG